MINQATHDDATPLFVASYNGHLPVVRSLIDAGAPINQAKNDGVSPLSIASQNGHLAIVRLLIDSGALVDQANNDGVTPILMTSLSIQPDRDDCFQRENDVAARICCSMGRR